MSGCFFLKHGVYTPQTEISTTNSVHGQRSDPILCLFVSTKCCWCSPKCLCRLY